MHLEPDERRVLLALAGHLIVADGQVSAEERTELAAIAAELGQSLPKALDDATGRHPTVDGAVEAAGRILRPEAREFIRTVLIDLAGVDGRDSAESELVSRVIAEWARNPA